MSLTDKALRERKWGEFPALRQILENKQVPDHCYGKSSADDNVFAQLSRFAELAILVHENVEGLSKALSDEKRKYLEADVQGHLHEDLLELQKRFEFAGGFFISARQKIADLFAFSDRENG